MLVLSRKEKEAIHIGPDIVVTVERIAGEKVRIGIEAPKDMYIARGELIEQQGESNEVQH